MGKVRLLYEYRGLKAIPTEWFEGKPIRHRYESCWYKGSETVDESIVKERISDLNVILNDFGEKKYRNIQIITKDEND